MLTVKILEETNLHLGSSDEHLVPLPRLTDVEERPAVMVRLDPRPVAAVLAHGEAGSHAQTLGCFHSSSSGEVLRGGDGLEIPPAVEHPEDAHSTIYTGVGENLQR